MIKQRILLAYPTNSITLYTTGSSLYGITNVSSTDNTNSDATPTLVREIPESIEKERII